jgi:hypothetical protein
MIAGVRYYVEIIARRQTVLAPILVFVAVLGIVYATDAGPPLAAAAVPAAVFVPVGAWLMRVCATAESRAFADVTLVALGSPGRRLVARAAAAMVFATGLTGAACAWARIANPHPYPAGVIVEIAAMTLAAATAGIGIGALFAPPLRATAGTAVLTVTVVVIVSLIVRWVPPLGPLLHAFIGVRPPTAAHAAFAIGLTAIVGAAAFAISCALGRRAG